MRFLGAVCICWFNSQKLWFESLGSLFSGRCRRFSRPFHDFQGIGPHKPQIRTDFRGRFAVILMCISQTTCCKATTVLLWATRASQILCGETHCDTNSSQKKYPCMDGTKKPSKLHLGYILKIESAKSCHFAKSPIAKRKAKIGRKPPNTWWAWGSKHKFWICLHRRSLQNSTQWKNFESWSGGPTPHG